MNFYLLVEGKRTEKIVYPKWLEILVPNFKRVQWAQDAHDENYFLFSGGGYPALLHNHLKNAIDEVNELNTFDFLVLVIDVDESSVEGRITEVSKFIETHNLTLNSHCELVIIPQNRCIETWFLGNQKIFKSNPQNTDLSSFIKFYDIKEKDPELMGKFQGFNTHSQFHADYCAKFLNERNISYTKKRPNGVVEKNYLDELISRNMKTGHINSFRTFLEFVKILA